LANSKDQECDLFIFAFNIETSIHNEIIKEGYFRFIGKEFFKCKSDDIKHIFEKYGTIYTTINEHKAIKSEDNKDEEIEQNSNILISNKIRTCEKCHKKFIKKSAYISHLSRINSCVKDTNINNTTCSYCNKIYSNKHNLSAHLKICKQKISENNNNPINELKKKLEEQNNKIQEQDNKIKEQDDRINKLLNLFLK
jgi:predicted RNase H-like nuclease (RuvC/YqgF family)